MKILRFTRSQYKHAGTAQSRALRYCDNGRGSHARLEQKADELGCEIACFQSNYEGELVSKVQEMRDSVDGILMNPAGLTTTSVSLRDALEDAGLPLVEIHLSNIHAREAWRRHSLFSEIAVGIIAGFRWRGYVSALEMLVGMLRDEV